MLICVKHEGIYLSCMYPEVSCRETKQAKIHEIIFNTQTEYEMTKVKQLTHCGPLINNQLRIYSTTVDLDNFSTPRSHGANEIRECFYGYRAPFTTKSILKFSNSTVGSLIANLSVKNFSKVLNRVAIGRVRWPWKHCSMSIFKSLFNNSSIVLGIIIVLLSPPEWHFCHCKWQYHIFLNI